MMIGCRSEWGDAKMPDEPPTASACSAALWMRTAAIWMRVQCRDGTMIVAA
jgi:hypothetical protein